MKSGRAGGFWCAVVGIGAGCWGGRRCRPEGRRYDGGRGAQAGEESQASMRGAMTVQSCATQMAASSPVNTSMV